MLTLAGAGPCFQHHPQSHPCSRLQSLGLAFSTISRTHAHACRCWVAASTEGLVLYSLGDDLVRALSDFSVLPRALASVEQALVQ